MKRVLVVGDSHIHERADEIPPEFYRVFRERAYDIVIHTGDLVDPDVADLFRSLGQRAYFVEGNMDYLDLPEREVVVVEEVVLGVVHGHQVRPRGNRERLAVIARDMGVSVLVNGHTHSPFIEEVGGVLLVNPGSVTGVWGGGGGSMTPSFIELEIDKRSLRALLYELERGEVVLREEKRYMF